MDRKLLPEALSVQKLVTFAVIWLALTVSAQAQFKYATNNGTIIIKGYTGPGGDVTIPDTINGLTVTTIGASAFIRLNLLTNVMLPDSVTSIGDLAFASCLSLTNVTMGNSVTNIGQQAFAGCFRLANATVPNSMGKIESMVFAWCSSLTNVTIPNSVTDIGNEAFSGCDSLTAVTIPNSVTTVKGGTFYRRTADQRHHPQQCHEHRRRVV